MSRGPVTARNEDGLLVVEAGDVTTLAEAEAVVDLLSTALIRAVADAEDPEFLHRIDWNGAGALPDAQALHEDARSDPEMRRDVADAFQPGAFWCHVADLPEGSTVIAHWLSVIAKVYADKLAEQGFEAEIWEHGAAGVQLGESALLPLVLKDPAWIPAYARALVDWDLGHEVHQKPLIDVLFERYPWDEQMRNLLIARVVIDGQHGPEQVFGEMREPLRDRLSPEEYDAFYRDALAGFRDETAGWFVWPPDEMSQKTFSIDGDLLDIARSLPPHGAEETT